MYTKVRVGGGRCWHGGGARLLLRNAVRLCLYSQQAKEIKKKRIKLSCWSAARAAIGKEMGENEGMGLKGEKRDPTGRRVRSVVR